MLSISATPREVCQSPPPGLRGQYTPLPTFPGQQVSADVPGSQRLFVHRWLEGDFAIVPDDKSWMEKWDMILIGALVVTAVLSPLDAALLHCTSPIVNGFIDVTDAVFLTDIFLQFNTAFSSGVKSSTFEGRPHMIAARYMGVPCSKGGEGGWFWPDMLTLIPWDDVLNMLEIHIASVRLIRLLRLLRILRLVRVVKLFKKWHTRVGMSMALLKIMTCAIATLFLTHWLACLWAYLGKFPEYYGQKKDNSWLQSYLAAKFGGDIEIGDLSHKEVYSYSLYFCTVVLTTVGFGDITPINHVEVVVMIVTIFTTGVTWAWVVGNIVNVITNLDAFGNLFNTAMDDLNSLMTANTVDTATRIRIRKHLHESYMVQKQKHSREAFVWLSEGLKGELAIQSGVDKICAAIWYFQNLPSNVVIELADEFKANLFSPNETVMSRDSASVILRGSCLKNGRLLTRDCCYGEDMILYSAHLKDSSCPVTLTFMEVMTIHREDMMEACDKYPDFNLRLRRAQVRLAVWRGFIYVAAKIRAAHPEHHHNKPVRARGNSTWDTQFFDVGKATLGVEDPRLSLPGWKECWEEDSKQNNGSAEGTRRTSEQPEGHTLQASMNEILNTVKSVRAEMIDGNLQTQRSLRSFEVRLDRLESEVAKTNERVEALGRETVADKFSKTPLDSPPLGPLNSPKDRASPRVRGAAALSGMVGSMVPTIKSRSAMFPNT